MRDEKLKESNENKAASSIAWANTIFWLGFWFLFIGGCTAVEIWGN